jgi:uncharacterized protein (TIGR00369 family)
LSASASPEAPWPEAQRFRPLAGDVLARWSRFLRPERRFFPSHVGLRLEEVWAGYARLRLPARPEVAQVAGYVHGGALSTLIDTSAVPALGTYGDEQPEMLTVSMTVNFTGVVTGEDAIGEAWVESASRSLAFVRVEVRGADSRGLAATASLIFRTRERRP